MESAVEQQGRVFLLSSDVDNVIASRLTADCRRTSIIVGVLLALAVDLALVVGNVVMNHFHRQRAEVIPVVTRRFHLGERLFFIFSRTSVRFQAMAARPVSFHRSDLFFHVFTSV